MTTEDLCGLSVSELVGLIAHGGVSPVEVCQASLDRLEATEPELNAFISLDHERVLADAAQLEAEAIRRDFRGPLHGVPIAIKDNIATGGERTTAGARIYDSVRPGHDATAVARLRAAGALIFGKTNLPELAYGPVDSYHYGPTHNPWDINRYAGGSSMGSAAAVAAGVVPAALGTDTTGSIRNPATWCGVVGLKPTYGLVPLRGVVPLATSFDHVGPLARSAEDCARVLSVIAGVDDLDPTTAPYPSIDHPRALDRRVTGLRVGVVRPLWDALETSVATPLTGALEALRYLGVELVDVELPAWDEVVDASDVLVACEAAAEYEPMLEAAAADLLTEVGQRLRTGSATPATEYVRARQVTERLRHEYQLALRDVHLFAFPGRERTAPRIDHSGRRLEPGATLRYVVPMNAIGAPALTMPAGFVEGLPISLQLAGGHGNDALLLSVAHAYQKLTSWHMQRPPIGERMKTAPKGTP